MKLSEKLKYDDRGLVPAVAQDETSGEVLMVAWMDKEAVEKTIETKKAHYYSRSRDRIWMKGESSGHVQEVEGIYVDCDSDTLLLKVRQAVAACHTGHYSCFFRKLDKDRFVEVSDKIFNEGDVYGK